MPNHLSSVSALTCTLALAALLGACGGTALAQQSDAKPDAPTTQPAAPGWSLMTWTERNEHRTQMRSVKTYEECSRYLDEHHAKMAERAKAQGKPELAQPKRDACAGLKS